MPESEISKYIHDAYNIATDLFAKGDDTVFIEVEIAGHKRIRNFNLFPEGSYGTFESVDHEGETLKTYKTLDAVLNAINMCMGIVTKITGHHTEGKYFYRYENSDYTATSSM